LRKANLLFILFLFLKTSSGFAIENPLMQGGFWCEEPNVLPPLQKSEYCVKPHKGLDDLMPGFYESSLRVYEKNCLERKNEFTKPFAVYFSNARFTKQKHIIFERAQPKVFESVAFDNFADEQFVYWHYDANRTSGFPRELLLEFTFGNTMRVSRFDLSLERNNDSRFNLTPREKKLGLANVFSPTLHKCEVYYSHEELDDKLKSVFEAMKSNSEKQKKREKPLSERKF